MHLRWPVFRSAYRRHRDALQGLLETLPIPIPWRLDAFCVELSAHASRPIELVDIHSSAGPWSLWVAGKTTDYIVVEQDTSPFHHTQLALREIGHLLLDPQLPDTRGDPLTAPPPLQPHPADRQAVYDLFGHLLLERVEHTEQQHKLARLSDPRRAAALRAAALLEGRP